MNEKNMKNYSIRLDDEEVKRLDALSTRHFYWKRSGVIRGILLAVFYALSDNEIYDLISYGFGASGVNVTITINRK